jgi:hypothetical protein
MLENQFIQFTDSIDPLKREIAVPIKAGTSFFAQVAQRNGYKHESTIDIVTPNGDETGVKASITNLRHNGKSSKYALVSIPDMGKLAPNDCFRLKLHEKSYYQVQVDGSMSADVQATSDYKNSYEHHIGTFEDDKFRVTIKNIRVVGWASNGAPYDVPYGVGLYIGKDLSEIQLFSEASDVSFEFEVESEDVSMYVEFLQNTKYSKYTITYDEIYSDQDEQDITTYSNLLCRVIGRDYSTIQYSCSEDAFGFPFSHKLEDGTTPIINQVLPLLLTSPQYKQEDKIYTKRNGENVVLYANITKEYDGHTEYIPSDWHEKTLMALSSDKVYINGEKVTKNNTYEIDHEKSTTHCDCDIRLTRATFKMTTNVTQRNSNY